MVILKIEVNQNVATGHKATQTKSKNLNVFDFLFNKSMNTSNIKSDSSSDNSSLNQNIALSLKALFNLDLNNGVSSVRDEISDLLKNFLQGKQPELDKFLDQNTNIFDLKSVLEQNIKLSQLNILVSKKELNTLVSSLETLLGKKIDKYSLNLMFSNTNSLETTNSPKQDSSIVDDEPLTNDYTDKELDGTMSSSNLSPSSKILTDLHTKTEPGKNNNSVDSQTQNTPEAILPSIKNNNSKDNSDENDDIFEQLKKHRIEIGNSQFKVDATANTSVNTYNSEWHLASSKKDELKLDSWIDSFKKEIDKLSEFRIENKQKVSMMLKEQGEQLRITVEKRDDFIFIEAKVTDNMKDRLDSILTEVQGEMKEKGIEVKVEISQDQEEQEEREHQNERNSEQKNSNKENQHQGGNKRNGRNSN